MERIAYRDQTLSRWRVGPSTYLALPEHGARLLNWNLTLGDGSIRDVIYWPEEADFTQFPKIRGGNPILFPFSARCFDGGEQNFWRGPDGVRRPMPQHGFARQSVFKILWQDPRGFAAQLVPNAETHAAYPYEYEFTVTYRFESFALACELSLKNLGPKPLPWSPGHHFYFTVPWTDGATRDEYVIRIAAAERLRQDAEGRLQPGPHLRDEERLSEPALVDTLHTRLRVHEIAFGEPGRPGDVIMHIGTKKVPPPDATIVTWTAGEAAPFYCVEPWMGPPNAPGHKRGLQWVPPLETGTFSVSVAVK